MGKLSMNWKNALKLSLFLGLFWFLVLILGFMGYSTKWMEKNVEFTEILLHGVKQFVMNTLLFFILFCFQFSIFKKKWKTSIKLRVSIAGCLLFILLFIGSFEIFSHFFDTQQRSIPNIFIMLAIAIVVTAITTLLTSLFYMIVERQKTIVENQKLTIENMQARYETLKSQINPHFLFNSLNTLNGLIGLDAEKAKEFVQQLSFVFRYSIQNKKCTTLDEELVCISAFCNLMKIRYGQSLAIEYRIDNDYRSHYIVPLSLQMLVENAIKHNTISNRYPLTITIETSNNSTVRVCNRIQPKNENTSGEGVGLANMTERYRIMYEKEVTIYASNGLFCVEIPLIKTEK